jgi:hypothetical protein
MRKKGWVKRKRKSGTFKGPKRKVGSSGNFVPGENFLLPFFQGVNKGLP